MDELVHLHIFESPKRMNTTLSSNHSPNILLSVDSSVNHRRSINMENNNEIRNHYVSARVRKDERPVFPKRAVITAGMPYGNKELHFGHVGGMFVHADTFARFMKDRIGKDNVIFVSGTDCYGSPIMEGFRKKKENEGYDKTIEDYVMANHVKQHETLEKYEITPDLYAASALGRAAQIHEEVSKDLFNALYDGGYLIKDSTPQFFDTELNVFLNGRQVVGKCPFEGCTSDHGYADECSLGHQYMPSDLIDPVSTLSGKKPAIKEVTNWYFDLERWIDDLQVHVTHLKKDTNTRKYQLNAIDEFLKKPIIYVQKKHVEDLEELQKAFPEHELINEEKKPSYTFVFKNLHGRDLARAVLDSREIRYRTGKTLVPFRLSGNISWGVPLPEKDDMKDLTFWVWPESLWAPISFTKAYLESIGKDNEEYRKFWFNKDACVYQFIGEDNIYFYGIAEMAMFAALQTKKGEKPVINDVVLPHLIANNHILFMDKKASSSSEIKPPMADELLSYYTAEQLRMHFLSLGLSTKSVGFKPMVYMPEEEQVGVDPVLKEGNLLTNVFNRLIRSCFYSAQEYFDGKLPYGTISEKIQKLSEETILEYERHMYNHDFHRITYVLDTYIRELNKYWSNNMRNVSDEDADLRKQILIDCFHGIRVTTALVHPLAPTGCDLVREYLRVDERLWNWEYILEPIYSIVDDKENHELKFLEPKFDFFKKHDIQIKAMEENE